MPPSTSTIRRHTRAEDFRRRGFVVMRACQPCTDRQQLCYFSRELNKCVDCYKFDRKCDLAPNVQDFDKQHDILDRLDDEILALHQKLKRKRTERRLALKRLKELNDRESLNILELEEDEKKTEAALSPNAALADLVALSPSESDRWLGGTSSAILDTK